MGVREDAERLLDRCPPPERWHGTAGGYSNHKCRCDPCRLAHNKKCRDYQRRRRAARGPIGPRAIKVEPLVCDCAVPAPDSIGECGSCHRLVVFDVRIDFGEAH